MQWVFNQLLFLIICSFSVSQQVGVMLLMIAGLSAGLPIQPRSLTSELPSTDINLEITSGEPTTMDGINARSKRSVDLYGDLEQNLEQVS